jgi:hypothetical protein
MLLPQSSSRHKPGMSEDRGMKQGGRPDFSNRWHRDLLLKINQTGLSGLSGKVHASFDDVATQMRFFYEFQFCKNGFWHNELLPGRLADTLADRNKHCSTRY